MLILGNLWYIIIFVLIISYFALDGFDLGAGVLYPFVAKDEKDKGRIMKAIGPVWDGNEVWLLTAGGALFAAFAPAYATVFSGFYLAIMLVLFGLIFRAVAVEYRAHGGDMPKVWDVLFFVGSLLPALLLGVAMGNIIQGLPLDAHGDYVGGFFALLNPFALLCGVLGLVHMLTQGAAWIALKAPVDSELRAKCAKLRRTLALVDLVLFVVVTAAFFLLIAPTLPYAIASTVLAGVFAVLYVIGMVVTAFVSKADEPKGDLLAIVAAGVGCLGLSGIIGATQFPNLVPALDPALSLTVANCASSDVALFAMTIIAVIGVPLVLVYHVLTYRAFRGRVD
ncbi:MAG: cytochrome d ubiquinol oxidase subunit II [Coriobacteriia bacterium]|nr:cytochrome d ubiquinol oxidase subunit II [Coriobacteriia bacterium]